MFAQRRAIRSLYHLARERAKARSIRIRLHLLPLFRSLFRGGLRLLTSVGFGIACARASPQNVLAFAGGLGLMLLSVRWDRAFADALPPPRYFSFYPASAERIWNARFKLFQRLSFWFAVDALAIISCLAIDHQISLPSALASIPSAFALAAWMIALPLLLTLLFPSFRPGFIILLAVLLIGASFCLTNTLPALASSLRALLAAVAWSNPAGWFYLFARSGFDPAYRFLFNTAALIAGILLIRPIAAALEHRVIPREMNADASDSRVSPGEMAEPESESEPQIQPQAATTPLGEARSVLDGEDWAPFPGPKTFAEKLFWRTLSDRQKMIARLLWPLGFRWNIGHPAILRFAASLVAIAVTIRLVSSSEYTWLALAAGTTAVFMFAPPLPGYQFIFQRLYLGGRCATRCQLLPVSVSEICSVLSRCQTIRAAAAWWIGAAYGALAWSIMGAPVRVGVAAGLSLILISYGFHPLVLVAKLSRVTRDRGRRFAFFPSLFVVGLTAVIGLIATLVSIIAMIMFGTEPSRVLSSLLLMLLFMLSFAAALRFSGWILLKIYLLMIERSWLDAVVKIPGKR